MSAEEDKQVQTEREGETFQTVDSYTFDCYGLESTCAKSGRIDITKVSGILVITKQGQYIMAGS